VKRKGTQLNKKTEENKQKKDRRRKYKTKIKKGKETKEKLN
jgi:hypothetical protein